MQHIILASSVKFIAKISGSSSPSFIVHFAVFALNHSWMFTYCSDKEAHFICSLGRWELVMTLFLKFYRGNN